MRALVSFDSSLCVAVGWPQSEGPSQVLLVELAMNGVLAGLVSITSACATVSQTSSSVIAHTIPTRILVIEHIGQTSIYLSNTLD